MAHLVILFAAVCLGFSWWYAVRNIPWVYSLLIPRNLMFALGCVLLVSAGLLIPVAMQEPRSPAILLRVLAQGWWGSFLLLLPAAAMLARTELDELLRRIGLMLGAVTAVLILSLYPRSP